jgi:hypothetical protein
MSPLLPRSFLDAVVFQGSIEHPGRYIQDAAEIFPGLVTVEFHQRASVHVPDMGWQVFGSLLFQFEPSAVLGKPGKVDRY